MNQTPFFSVVIPSYNRAGLLKAVLQSVQAQTFADFEIVLVDDGSTDDTERVVKEIAAVDPRIRYQHQLNAERGAARNTGIRVCKGDFVVFFDSDDEMKPDYLQVLQEGIQQHPEYAFYAARYLFLSGGKLFPSGITAVPAGPHGVELVLKGNPFSCNFCVRRAHPGLVLFETDRTLATMEDWMFLVENLHSGEQILLLEPVGVLMHEHEGRSMQQNELLIQRRKKAADRLLERHTFTVSQQKILTAYSDYFCSIHAYLDHDRTGSLRYLLRSVKAVGWNALFAKAALKYMAGRSLILKLSRRNEG
ncbi:MAG: glycosyltransferase family 2 protein [Sphingobacteriales bacterium]|nr:MAG: glycosyltransferase family 2 protein [Sphingobacteriales bacterium]